MANIRRSLTSAGIAFAMICGGTAVSALTAAPAQAATIDGIDADAVAHYSCATHTVYVAPFSMSPLNGDWPIWARAMVYDVETTQWTTGPWHEADGITDLTFTVGQPSGYALVTYAHFEGQWNFASDWVQITDDLDNAYPFC